jgi:hypothetical protein
MQLLPCPFCGMDERNPPFIHSNKKKHFDEKHFTVQCTNCGCEPDYCVTTEAECIKVWNNRKIQKEWISIKDITPDIKQWVLTYEPNATMQVKANYIHNYENEFMYGRNITHWQPMPEYPQEVKP